jgi:hypothetical protein
MLLLGYLNNTNNFKYDEYGFLIPEDNIIFFGDDFEKGLASFYCILKEKTDNKYVYYISITEEMGRFHFVSKGNVEIYYNITENSNSSINNIIVNGIENGILKDKYGDNFNITPNIYVHLLFNGNLPDKYLN